MHTLFNAHLAREEARPPFEQMKWRAAGDVMGSLLEGTAQGSGAKSLFGFAGGDSFGRPQLI
jgi:hypothetical protein